MADAGPVASAGSRARERWRDAPVRSRLRFTRSIDIGPLQDTFLIAAVGMIIVIRLQLWATNYPQLGGGGLHIAHLLWGGLFMLIAIMLLVSLVGRGWRQPAAVIGGVGFGFFIDEFGKFVTEDNNYFFKPTAACIYVIFIVLYTVTRLVRRRWGFSERERRVNAVDLLKDAAGRGLTAADKERALALLDDAGPHPLVEPLRRLLHDTEALPEPPPSRLTTLARAARDRYYRLVDRPWFTRVLSAIFILWVIVAFLQVVALSLVAGLTLGGVQSNVETDGVQHLDFVNIAAVVSTVVAAGFMAAGVRQLRRGDRAAAYWRFERGLLVTIFVTQVFVFAESSFGATTGFLLSLLLFVTVRYMARQEAARARPAQRTGGGLAPATPLSSATASTRSPWS